MYATTPRRKDWSTKSVVGFLLAGAAVALSLGLYGRYHESAAQSSTNLFLFNLDFDSSRAMASFKSWFTTIAIAFALVQLVSGLRLRDKISWPKDPPLWYADFHRLCGTLALVFCLPVAYHCLWSLGFQTKWVNPRAVIHSFLGCFFFGAFVTKVLAVRSDHMPTWMVPIVGGAVLVALTGIWITSALYFFTGRLG